MEVCGAIYIASCGSVPSAIPPRHYVALSPLTSSGAQEEYINARHPPRKQVGKGCSWREAFFLFKLAAPQAVGRKEVYRRSPSPPKKWGWAGRRSGGKIIFPDHYKETRCLQLPVMPNEFGVCMVYGRCAPGEQ